VGFCEIILFGHFEFIHDFGYQKTRYQPHKNSCDKWPHLRPF
jgi:hypothetical protein